MPSQNVKKKKMAIENDCRELRILLLFTLLGILPHPWWITVVWGVWLVGGGGLANSCQALQPPPVWRCGWGTTGRDGAWWMADDARFLDVADEKKMKLYPQVSRSAAFTRRMTAISNAIKCRYCRQHSSMVNLRYRTSPSLIFDIIFSLMSPSRFEYTQLNEPAFTFVFYSFVGLLLERVN